MLRDLPCVVVAVDHAPLGLVNGLDDVEQRIVQILDGQPDGLIGNYGLLRQFRPVLESARVTPIARLDGNRTYLAGDWTASSEWQLFYDAEACCRIGAGAAIVNLLLGGPAELVSLSVVARAATACHAVDIPLLVSAMYLPSRSQAASTDESRDRSHSVRIDGPSISGDEGKTFAARMAFELGADFVVAYNASDPASLKRINRWCPTPILAQGSSGNSPSDMADWARSSIKSGAKGVVVGRAVWQNRDPKSIVTSLRRGVSDESQ